jgi:hypothetical protein
MEYITETSILSSKMFLLLINKKVNVDFILISILHPCEISLPQKCFLFSCYCITTWFLCYSFFFISRPMQTLSPVFKPTLEARKKEERPLSGLVPQCERV